jgi:DNA polymerase elongation subunit (family B)
MRGNEERPTHGRDIVLDIETVSALSQAQYEAAIAEIEPDARLKDPDKIEARRNKKISEIVEKAGLSPATGRICCLGICPVDEPERAEAIIDQDEGSMLRALDSVLSGHDIPVRLITFSGKGFDLPYLIVRAAYHHLAFRAPLPWRKYDYHHVDLREILTSGSLNSWEIALLGKHKEIEGNQVQALWDAGDHEAIRAHCLEDVVRTAELWRIIRPVIEGSEEIQKGVA